MSAYVSGGPKKPKPWLKDLAVMAQTNKQNRITHITISDDSGATLTADDFAWVKMALATTGERAKPVATITKQFEHPIEETITRSLGENEIAGLDKLDKEELTVLARDTTNAVMHTLGKVDILSLLADGEFFDNAVHQCSHGYSICAPCGFLPPEVTAELMTKL